MKHFTFILLAVSVLFTLACGKIVQIPTASPPQKCAFSCTNTDLKLCATNGQCMQEFQGECLITSYNCEHPHKPFVIIEDWKCKQSGAPKCAQNEVQLY